jgi:hypothetical protein
MRATSAMTPGRRARTDDERSTGSPASRAEAKARMADVRRQVERPGIPRTRRRMSSGGLPAA